MTSVINDKKVKVRGLFAKQVWDSEGKVSAIEKISDLQTYQVFFNSLAQSVYLTANDVM